MTAQPVVKPPAYVENLIGRQAVIALKDVWESAVRVENVTGCFLSYGGDSNGIWVKLHRPKKPEEFDPSDLNSCDLVYEERWTAPR